MNNMVNNVDINVISELFPSSGYVINKFKNRTFLCVPFFSSNVVSAFLSIEKERKRHCSIHLRTVSKGKGYDKMSLRLSRTGEILHFDRISIPVYKAEKKVFITRWTASPSISTLFSIAEEGHSVLYADKDQIPVTVIGEEPLILFVCEWVGVPSLPEKQRQMLEVKMNVMREKELENKRIEQKKQEEEQARIDTERRERIRRVEQEKEKRLRLLEAQKMLEEKRIADISERAAKRKQTGTSIIFVLIVLAIVAIIIIT